MTNNHSKKPREREPDRTQQGLYVNQAELLARLNIGERAWRRVLPSLVQSGFPPKDTLVNKWFWPQVEAFLFRRHGLSDTIAASDESNLEDWNE